jgi:hypothetical protein
MTLTTATETTRPHRMRLRRVARLSLTVDVALMAVSLAICVILFTHGGFLTLLFGVAGAAIGSRQTARGGKVQAAYSGGFAGLFVGALFAAFFHSALAAALAVF